MVIKVDSIKAVDSVKTRCTLDVRAKPEIPPYISVLHVEPQYNPLALFI